MGLGVDVTELTSRGLATAVARAVRDRTLAEGHRLPPIRAVAEELGVSPTTVAAAWQLLSRSGVIATAGRRGTVVATRSRENLRYRRAVNPISGVTLDLSTGVPDPRLLPDLGSAVRALTEAVAPGSYLDVPELPELQDRLRADWPFAVRTVMVVDGAMDGLDLVARALLGFADRVVVETPCFPPLLDLLESHGVEVVAVGLDDEGIELEGLHRALAEPTRAVILQPRAQNPTGISMSPRRARQIAEFVTGTDTIVIEDESWAAVAQADPVSVGAFRPEQTVHIRSFSKSHGPDLRLAALSGPDQLMRDLRTLRLRGQGWSSRILQRILLALLTDDTASATVARARATYAERRARTIAALSAAGVEVGGTDGFNLWIPVADETSAVLALGARGIGVAPGSPFQADTDGPPHIRVTVSALADDYDRVAEAIADAAQRSDRPVV